MLGNESDDGLGKGVGFQRDRKNHLTSIITCPSACIETVPKKNNNITYETSLIQSKFLLHVYPRPPLGTGEVLPESSAGQGPLAAARPPRLGRVWA